MIVPLLHDYRIQRCHKQTKLNKKFKPVDGPFFMSLDNTLAQLHFQRQAYHGGTFVGNHVHKLVQV